MYYTIILSYIILNTSYNNTLLSVGTGSPVRGPSGLGLGVKLLQKPRDFIHSLLLDIRTVSVKSEIFLDDHHLTGPLTSLHLDGQIFRIAYQLKEYTTAVGRWTLPSPISLIRTPSPIYLVFECM